jgi:hypothetical protein
MRGTAVPRVALATSEALSDLTEDDRLLVSALRALGVAAEPAVWSAAGVPWQTYDAVGVRSCWDYHLRLAEFLHWIGTLESAGVRVWNPPGLS